MKGLIAGITLLITGLGCSAQSDQVNHINSEQFKKVIQNEKGTLLDVRTESEFLNGHLPHAGQLNFYSFNFNKKLLLLPKDQPVYLYCNTGWRSKKAAETLVKNGYTNVYNLEEGIMEWELLNLPVVVEPNARPETKDKMEWDEFNALVESGKTVFIDFYAPWCAPCRQMMPMIDDLKNDYAGKISVVKINADASKKLVKKLELGTVPYFVLYNQGQQIFSHKGMIERNRLENLFSEYLR